MNIIAASIGCTKQKARALINGAMDDEGIESLEGNQEDAGGISQ